MREAIVAWKDLAGEECGVCGNPATISYPAAQNDSRVYRCCQCCDWKYVHDHVFCCGQSLTRDEALLQHRNVTGTKEPEYE